MFFSKDTFIVPEFIVYFPMKRHFDAYYFIFRHTERHQLIIKPWENHSNWRLKSQQKHSGVDSLQNPLVNKTKSTTNLDFFLSVWHKQDISLPIPPIKRETKQSWRGTSTLWQQLIGFVAKLPTSLLGYCKKGQYMMSMCISSGNQIDCIFTYFGSTRFFFKCQRMKLNVSDM